MNDTHYQTITTHSHNGVTTVTINNPPVNVLDVRLMSELNHFLRATASDPDSRVLVFTSANPDFFIAHVDMTLIDEPHAFDELARDAQEGLNPFQAFGELLRNQPQVTIVRLEGLARGGGAEFIAAADMTFAAQETAGLAQCEALMGIIPGGGATQYLSSRMSRGRALEIILGAGLIDAVTAERYGWINRAIPAARLGEFIDELSHNIASLPDGVITAAKQALPPQDFREGFQREHAAWFSLFMQPNTEKLIRGGLREGAQTPKGEKNLEQLLRNIKP